MKSTNESDWTFPAVQSFGVVCCTGAGVLEQFWRVLPELKELVTSTAAQKA